jgi:ubiquinone/menaquinone biosynthesis C-methylase UbiE
VVVDLGCGGGIDVILAALKVGSHGRVVGVDFTPQMIEGAAQAVSEAGLTDRTELLVGDMTRLQLPDSATDVVISNCVINLIPDKEAVYGEAFRILRHGGRIAISDVVLMEDIAPDLRAHFKSTWAGCMGGAIEEADYFGLIERAGFRQVEVVARHVLTPEELKAMAACPGEQFAPAPAQENLSAVEGKVASIKFTATKPALSQEME